MTLTRMRQEWNRIDSIDWIYDRMKVEWNRNESISDSMNRMKNQPDGTNGMNAGGILDIVEWFIDE